MKQVRCVQLGFVGRTSVREHGAKGSPANRRCICGCSSDDLRGLLQENSGRTKCLGQNWICKHEWCLGGGMNCPMSRRILVAINNPYLSRIAIYHHRRDVRQHGEVVKLVH